MRPFIILLSTLLLACNSPELQHESRQVAVKDTVLSQRVTVPIKKFVAPVSFADFKVDTFNDRKAAIDYGSSPTARRFRTVITETYRNNPIMFGGHFIFVRWGCGTSCKNGALVDIRNGKVYDLPMATIDYSYEKDSRLLIVNPPDSSGHYEDCGYCEPELWVWNDKQKKFEQYSNKK
ncbi:MAG TPA: hypothetical protein VD794_07720 [Flavisolibacter sp.]|nr:hypothetical protein [Flavisolibacter sp.]